MDKKNKQVRKKLNPRARRRKNTFRYRPQRIPDVVPSTWICNNRYISEVIGYTPGAQTYGAFDYYINSPFGPDVSGTDTSSAIGVTELITLYANSLVLSAHIVIEICNEEDFEVVFVGAPSTQALDASIGSASETLQLSELPWGKSRTLGRSSGMNRARLTWNINMSKLMGSRSLYFGDQNWIGLSGRPTNKLYITFGVAALSGNNLTNGITFRLSMNFKTRWTSRKFDDITLDSTGPRPIIGTRKLIDPQRKLPELRKWNKTQQPKT